MVFFRIISNITGPCSLLSFGNRSWIGTVLGSSNDSFMPSKNEKQIKNDKNKQVSFEFNDKFKVL